MLKRISPISTVLFDLDGTLLDTAPDLAGALNQLLINHTLAPLSFDTVRPHASEGSPGLLRLGFGIAPSHSHYASLRQEFLSIYQARLTEATQLFPGIAEVLDYLDNHKIPWGIVTNKPTLFAQQLLEHFELTDRCHCLVGGDMVNQIKPAPEGLLLACEMINKHPSHCIYVGDAERDILAAKNAHMRSLVALYGYIHAHEQPQSWQADGVIYQPIDLLEWFMNT